VGENMKVNWREMALQMYAKLYGKRCVQCSSIVNVPTDGVLFEKYNDYMLMHKKCVKKDQ
jgi:hypothetical protein